MTVHQLTLPLEESATQFTVLHSIDGRPHGDPMPALGTFEEAGIARAEVVRMQQTFQEHGVAQHQVVWEDQPRATGWFGTESRDGRTIIHELALVKVR